MSYNTIIDSDGIAFKIAVVLDKEYRKILDNDNTITTNIILEENMLSDEVVINPFIKLDQTATHLIESEIREIHNEVQAEKTILLVGGSNTYRRNIDMNYKSNRVNKYIAVNRCKRLLQQRWKATWVNDIETDDAVAITYTHYRNLGENCILVHDDKDLLQVPGMHLKYPTYHRRTFELFEVTEEDALNNLLIQIGKGDNGDGVSGIQGIGDAKIKDLLLGRSTKGQDGTVYNNIIADMYETYVRKLYTEYVSLTDIFKPHIVLEAYITRYGVEQGLYEFANNTLLLYMLRNNKKKEFKIPEWVKLKK